MAAQGICSVSGCGKPVVNSRGWCNKHYQRWQKHGDPAVSLLNRSGVPILCSVPECGRPSNAHGMCAMHYERVRMGKGVGGACSERGRRARWLEQHAGHTENECLIWPFSVGDHGRGSVQVNNRIMSAPRYMCMLVHGEPPTPEHEAAHSCGKGHIGCVHPGHLSWKTPVENEADKRDHGTLRRGRDISTNKLTEAQVREIRRRLPAEGGKALAAEFGVTPSQISSIKLRHSWAWLI